MDNYCHFQIQDLNSGSDLLTSPRGIRKATGCYHPEGYTYLAATSDQTVRRYEIPSGREIDGRMPHPSNIEQTTYTPDAQLIVTTDMMEDVRLWHTATAKRVGPTLRGARVRISPDNKAFVTHNGESIQLYDMPTPRTGDIDEVIRWVEETTGQKVN